jgi:nitrite reductase/ring-hydroxylating ferredoxin subunit
VTVAPDRVHSGRSSGISYQQLLDTDTHPVPPCLREESAPFQGDQDVSTAYYTERRYHELEKEKLWSRVWQFACREEHIPEPGDTYVYEIAERSYLIVRGADGQIRGYPNACLHRGRALRDGPGRVQELRCSFHGFCWNLDGSLKQVPCEWDFPQLDRDQFHLTELPLATWAGFVFINPDPASQPFEDFLGVMADHFERWDLGNRFVEVHVAKRIRANWKIAQEAFSEAFHVVATHPQLLPGIGDANSQYDIWGNVSRAITPNGTPSPHLSWEPTEQQMFDSMIDRRLDEDPVLDVPDGMTARELSAKAAREAMRPLVGDAVEEFCDAELVDSLDYSLFPNFHPWGAFNRIVYRFRPNGDDHRTCIMECIYLSPFAGERPPPAEVHWLDFDEDWMVADELGSLARVFDQDSFNMPRVMAGLLSAVKPGLTLGLYQESKLRQFYNLLDEYFDRD